jgi:hypothetical protein
MECEVERLQSEEDPQDLDRVAIRRAFEAAGFSPADSALTSRRRLSASFQLLKGSTRISR